MGNKLVPPDNRSSSTALGGTTALSFVPALSEGHGFSHATKVAMGQERGHGNPQEQEFQPRGTLQPMAGLVSSTLRPAIERVDPRGSKRSTPDYRIDRAFSPSDMSCGTAEAVPFRKAKLHAVEKAARNKQFAFVAAFLVCSWPSALLHAQGCSQCRDNVSQTNPGVQASYRTAIFVLLGAVTAFSVTAFVVVRRLK